MRTSSKRGRTRRRLAAQLPAVQFRLASHDVSGVLRRAPVSKPTAPSGTWSQQSAEFSDRPLALMLRCVQSWRPAQPTAERRREGAHNQERSCQRPSAATLGVELHNLMRHSCQVRQDVTLLGGAGCGVELALEGGGVGSGRWRAGEECGPKRGNVGRGGWDVARESAVAWCGGAGCEGGVRSEVLHSGPAR